MESENSIEPTETGCINDRIVTHPSLRNKNRSDAEIWKELEQAARRVDLTRLKSFIKERFGNGRKEIT
jgi:hypothetical protein